MERNTEKKSEKKTSGDQRDHHRVYFFAPKRWRIGVLHGIEAIALGVAGTWLIFAIWHETNLRSLLLLLCAGLFLGAWFQVQQAIVDLLGFLRLDEQGIHLRQGSLQESISWNRIASWNVGRSDSPFELSRYFEFSVRGEPGSVRTIDGTYLRADQFNEIRDWLARFHARASHRASMGAMFEEGSREG